MFNRSKTEIDDREDLEKDIALLRPQLNHLKDQADAERVAKQRELLPQIDTLKQRCKAEVPALENKARELLEEKKSCVWRYKRP